jgi:hypothetical protein
VPADSEKVKKNVMVSAVAPEECQSMLGGCVRRLGDAIYGTEDYGGICSVGRIGCSSNPV